MDVRSEAEPIWMFLCWRELNQLDLKEALTWSDLLYPYGLAVLFSDSVKKYLLG